MRKSFILLGAVVFVLSGASAAGAGTLTGATLSFGLPGVQAIGGPAVFQASAAATGQSSASAASLGAGSAIQGSVTLCALGPCSAPLSQRAFIFANVQGNGKLAASAGGAVSITAPFSLSVGRGLSTYKVLQIPLTIGSGNTAFGTDVGGLLGISVVVSPWRLGKVARTGFFTSMGVPQTAGTVLSTTPSGQQQIRVQTTGSFSLTANGKGTVKLVALTHIVLSGASTSDAYAPTTLTLTYKAPEPGTLLLLGAGIASMLAAGARRARA